MFNLSVMLVDGAYYIVSLFGLFAKIHLFFFDVKLCLQDLICSAFELVILERFGCDVL